MSRGSIERRLAVLPGVKSKRQAAAENIGAKARSNLAAHRRTGDSSIKVEHGPVDSLIYLNDKASLSIEFGHGTYIRKDGAVIPEVEGLHILGRAVRG